MGVLNDRRRRIQNNRRKLVLHWRTSDRQEIRSKFIASVHDDKPIASAFISTLTSEDTSEASFDLRCINLSGQNLDGIDLTGAKLQGASLARCSLKKAKLVGADLRDTLLRNTDLTDADLRDANLDGAIMENTNFQGSNLEGVHITNATIVAGTTQLPESLRQLEESSWFTNSLTNFRIKEQKNDH